MVSPPPLSTLGSAHRMEMGSYLQLVRAQSVPSWAGDPAQSQPRHL